MKILSFALVGILLVGSIGVVNFNEVFGEPDENVGSEDENTKSTISAYTDKKSYQNGDAVVFSGKVTNYEFGKTVSYVMDDPDGYLLSMGLILPKYDGSFTETFESDLKLWRMDGNYEIKYNYDDDSDTKSQLTYYYSTLSPNEPPIESPPVPDTYSLVTPAYVTVSTDKGSYVDGDVIEIYGSVSDASSPLPVTIKIKDKIGNNSDYSQTNVKNGKFSLKINVDGDMWKTGSHNVLAEYNGASAEFKFRIEIPEKTSSYKGSIPMLGYDVLYSIEGGKLRTITPYTDLPSISISISDTSNGQLTLTLPRSLIDAKIGTTDANFFVLIHGEEVDFEEKISHSSRTLTIPFPPGTSGITVMGTMMNTASKFSPDLIYTPSVESDEQSSTSSTKSSSSKTFTEKIDTNHPSVDDDSVNIPDLIKPPGKKIDVIPENLDSKTHSKIKSLDSKINREQSQYDEYLKQYDYYEGKTLSSKDEQKFQKVVEKLNSQNEKVVSLIDERNMVVLESDDVSEVIEEKAKPVQAVKQVEEKQQKQTLCFLFWCW